MKSLRPPVASLWLVFSQILLCLRLGNCAFNCAIECFDPYRFSFLPVRSCDTITTVLCCYETHQQACDQQSIFFFLARAQSDSTNNGCSVHCSAPTTEPRQSTSADTLPLPENETATTPSPMPDPCPSLPNIHNANLSLAMSQANISPKFQPSEECAMTTVDALRQCSLFMVSQLRAFTSYRGGLETCSLPGAWYLLRHPSLTIEVEGTSLEPGSNHTRLTKVNVTFHSHPCNPIERTYVAYNTEPLPSEFMPALIESQTSPLQIMFGLDQNVVTLMATWLNTTIIVRQYSGFLSVTLRVPREMSLASEGLCTGCPSHMYVNLTAFLDRIPSLCPSDNTKALNNCFDYGGVANEAGLENIHNNSYLDACVFNLFKTKTSEVLTMINAIADDAKLLVNVGSDPRPIPTLPPLFTEPSSTETIAHSADTTMEVVCSGTSIHPSAWVLLSAILYLTLSVFR